MEEKNRLWGGRFSEPPDAAAVRFSGSLGTDIRLIEEDIEGSIAHARMLGRVKIVSRDESLRLVQGLEKIRDEWRSGSWKPSPEQYEDVHSAVESHLGELIGELAGKLHTGRSRNDQIATDELLWLKKAVLELTERIVNFQRTLVAQAEAHTETLLPGYTHLQRAQAVSLAFHWLAYVQMLERDKQRFFNLQRSVTECPLGSGALAGSTLPLDREFTAKALGFEKPTANALDTVSNRDHFLDLLHTISTGMIHLSRLGEELVLWSTKEWDFIRLSDAWTTGSSLMPQKKNPDMAELIRGKTGRVAGAYISLTTTLKGLPLSYNRDLQEDKGAVFDAFDTYRDSLTIMERMVATLTVNAVRFQKELQNDFSEATDIADRLVLKGVPFREAHRRVGAMVRFAETVKKNFQELAPDEKKRFLETWDAEDEQWLRSTPPLFRKKTTGSPNPELVKKEIQRWKKILKT